MAVVGADGALEVRIGHNVGIELRRAQHLLSGLSQRHPLFAHLATNLLYRNQEVLLAYPKEAPGAYVQEAWAVCFLFDVKVLYALYLLPIYVIEAVEKDVVGLSDSPKTATKHLKTSPQHYKTGIRSP